MSITSIMLSGTSGIVAAQTHIRVASDNIANINTPGYARKIANQESVVVQGVGLGARISSITRASDVFLQGASLTAQSRSGESGVVADFLDQAQALFGDPSESSSFFAGLDKIYSAFSTASENPASSLGRNAAMGAVNDLLDNANRISTSIKALQGETDRQITSDVSRINDILKQIAQTNVDISRSSVMGGDASGSENIQAQLLDELSGLMSVQVNARTAGGVNVRSSDGVLLAGDGGASTLAYDKSQGVGVLTSTPPNGVPQTVMAGGGEIDGLLQLGKTELPHVAEQLSEFVSQAVDELNRAHNANSSIPAPTVMTGRDTGLDQVSAVSGFTGSTRIAVVDPTGVVQKTVDIDFDNFTMSVNGAAAVYYGPAATFAANFKDNLNTSLGTSATADFSGGRLSLTAAGSNGMVVSDDPADPASKVGKGFSHFFGLNDLVTSSGMTEYDTGLKGTDQHGFTPGEVIKMQLTDSSGNLLRAVNVTVPAAGTMNSLLASLNSGVNLFGQFSLDANGRMSFTAAGNQDVQVNVATDDTHRGSGGPSISQLFGIGADARIARSETYSVRTDINLNYQNLALGKFDRTTAVGGAAALASGDGRGALSLSQSGASTTSFGVAGDMRAVQMSVLSYASELSGHIGSKASAAKDRQASADAVSEEAATRRASVEGVNLDEELVNLTTSPQAYNASARLITAAKDMYDTLLNMVG
ncbi:MAG: flgK [Brevundimonas sp.]|nr:flgK [Brevundimonas sp.]